MLQAGLFLDFKGTDTLLIWGDSEGIAALRAAMVALSRGDTSHIQISGDVDLSVSLIEASEGHSNLSRLGRGLEWTCARRMFVEAEALLAEMNEVETGHHYFEVSGLAAQVIVSKGEYPAEMRP